MKLHTLKPAEGSITPGKRIARGQGSGRGGTSTRGHKGAQSRSGYSRKAGFEGGQMPLQRRVPKFGFRSPNRIETKPINLDTLQQICEKNKVNEINPEFLIKNGYANKKDLIKILKGMGEKGKISIRNVRREGNEDLKKQLKEKKITEDENKTFEKNIQKLTDTNIEMIDKILADKEKEILQI